MDLPLRKFYSAPPKANSSGHQNLGLITLIINLSVIVMTPFFFVYSDLFFTNDIRGERMSTHKLDYDHNIIYKLVQTRYMSVSFSNHTKLLRCHKFVAVCIIHHNVHIMLRAL